MIVQVKDNLKAKDGFLELATSCIHTPLLVLLINGYSSVSFDCQGALAEETHCLLSFLSFVCNVMGKRSLGPLERERGVYVPFKE